MSRPAKLRGKGISKGGAEEGRNKRTLVPLDGAFLAVTAVSSSVFPLGYVPAHARLRMFRTFSRLAGLVLASVASRRLLFSVWLS